ncbi:basement membrane-specific heparan sulfate proteoglycan core protein-like [Tubulanus polymorphus]|uniref:basement membrane-specific heparan sulfate proteoglycan core protein-like n=1 Tax=Tubulanus polymorphus TaxID=672921 RepID=UPI003DA57EB4
MAQNPAGRVEERVQVIVEPGVGLTIYPPRIEARAAEDIQFQCRSTGSPPPAVRWSRKRGILPISHRTENGILHLFQVSPDDAGMYVCSTRRPDGSLVTEEAELIVRGPPTIYIPQPRVEIDVGNPLRLICEITASPPFRVIWRKDGGGIPSYAVAREGVLHIPRSRVGDSGRYTCTVQSHYGSADGAIDVTVIEKDLIDVTTIEVPVGQTARLTCSVRGSGPFKITWTKIDGQLPADAIINDRVLILNNVKHEATGRFMCIAEGPFGTARGFIDLIVTGTLPLPTIEFTLGGTITLVCEPKGPGEFSITWEKVDGTLSELAIIRDRILKITNARERDAGRYKCTAVNEEETQEIFIEVTIKKKPPLIPVHEVQEGDSARLTCRVRGTGPFTITWFKQNGRLPTNAFPSNGVLDIDGIKPSDEGRYICRAVGPRGTQEALVDVRVLRGPVVPQIDVTYGGRAVLVCNPRGTGPFTITWQRLDGVVPSYAIQDQRRLIFKTAQTVDTGRYVCVAIGPDGSRQDIYIELTVTGSPPKVSKYDVQYDQTAQLTCNVRGLGSYTVTWQKVGGSLPSRALRRDRTLEIRNARNEDEGRYHCIAIGENGRRVDAFVDLDVLGSAPTVSKYDVGYDETATLTCNAQGLTRYTVTWQKVGGSLPSRALRRDRTLEIRNARNEDEGRYHCIAIGEDGRRADAYVDLNVIGTAPTISKYDVQYDQTATLTCNAQGLTRYTVTWQKVGGSLPSRALRRDRTLVIRNARNEDEGRYHCIAIGEDGRRADAYVDLNVIGSAPTIVKYDVQYDQTATLTCNAQGLTRYTVTWQKVGGSLPSRALRRDRTLEIRNARNEDEGRYHCIAISEDGRRADAYVDLNVIGTAPTISKYDVQYDQTALLTCNVQGLGSYTVTWQKVGGSLPSRALRRDRTLEIRNARNEDEGRYHCIAISEDGRQADAYVDLDVIGTAPTISKYDVQYDQTATLTCNAQGLTRYTVTWQKVGGSLPSRALRRDRTLEIRNARNEDEGRYHCIAIGEDGRRADAYVDLNVIGTAQTISKYDVQYDQTALITCNVQGLGSYTVTWQKVGGSLPSRALRRDRTLEIRNARNEDEGRYHCIAIGEDGRRADAYVDLNVIGSAPIISKYDVQYDQTATLTCNAQGLTRYTVTWQKVGGSLPSRALRRDSTLEIRNSRNEDEGRYHCIAIGEDGRRADAYVDLNVVGTAPTISKYDVQYDQTATLSCNAQGLTRYTVTWQKVGGSLPSRALRRDRTLEIRNARNEDEGRYHCIAIGEDGRRADAYVDLNVIGKN